MPDKTDLLLGEAWVIAHEVDGRYIRKVAGPFDTLEELWEWEHGHRDPTRTHYMSDLHTWYGSWKTMPLKEWERHQANARKYGPWHDLPEGHKLRPWSWACPDCGTAHGRGKGPYGLGKHYCPEGPQDIPGKEPREQYKLKRVRNPVYCGAAVPGYSKGAWRQCRNGVPDGQTYCYKHKDGCLHWESLKNQLPDTLKG